MIIVGYAALMAALGACALGIGACKLGAWLLIGVVSTGAMLVGAWRNAPRRKAPWRMLAAALGAMAVGDAIFGAGAGGGTDPPLAADIVYFTTFPLIMSGLVLLTRASVVLGDRSRLLDGLAVTCAVALLTWVFIVGPGVHAGRLAAPGASTLSAYVTGELLVLVATVRLAFGARHSPAVLLLAVGTAGVVASDLAYLLLRIDGGWRSGGIADLGYLAFYGCWGASALHPSMAALTAPVDHSPARLGRWWLLTLRLSAGVPPFTLLVVAAARGIRDGIAIAVTAFVIGEFVITRLADVVDKHRAALAREQVLRQACAALVAAVDGAEVSRATRAAVTRLLPDDADHEVAIRLAGCVDVDGAEVDLDLVPVPAADRMTRLVPTRMLHPGLCADLGRFDTVLVCPLLPERALGDPLGVLFVGAHGGVLAAMRDAVEVLAAQATLALERVALTGVINVRDGDRYLRTVVSNAADVVLVVDADERIRYASPSLATLFGVHPPADATLRDVVRADDHPQLAQTRQLAEHRTTTDGAAGVWTLRRRDGTVVVVEGTVRDLRRDRMVRGFVITMRDVTARNADQRQAATDALRHTAAWRNRQNLLNRFR